MDNREEILSAIKSAVLEEVPDAKVYLFGSRVTGNVHEESDWDILVLTDKKYPRSVKRNINDKIFPFSLSSNFDYDLLMITVDDWENSPAYYSLYLSVKDTAILI